MSPHLVHDERPDPLTDLAAAVRELTTSQVNAARFVRQDKAGRPHEHAVHVTRHPSLLDQLRAAGTAGRGEDAAMTGGYESRPAARLEAVDVLRGIASDADDWIVRKFTAEPRLTLEDNLRELVGLAGGADKGVQHSLARAASGWTTRARVVTGWDSAPWRPNAGCPACENVGGLRVRLEEHAAACLQCGETWSPDRIGILADYLRGVNADATTRRQQAARLRADLDGFFPYRGPCLRCDHRWTVEEDLREVARRNDARHLLLDEIVGRVLAGDSADEVAEEHALQVEAVHVAVAVATWPTEGLEPASVAG